MDSSSIVVKVQYGNTLKRFKVAIENRKLAIDNFTLREKIRGLFSIASGDDFTLTYLDEDHHEVTLSANGDDELDDILQQRLNPLFMYVKLTNTVNGGTSINYQYYPTQTGYLKNSVPKQKPTPYSRPNLANLIAAQTLFLSKLQAKSQRVKPAASQTPKTPSPVSQTQNTLSQPAVSQTQNILSQPAFYQTQNTLSQPAVSGFDQLSTFGTIQTLNSSSSLTVTSPVSQTQNTISQQHPYQASNNKTVAAGVSELVNKMRTDVVIKSED
ncbi:uncharacterized protein [Rutidosis leptorrhynchoides]|uniref:uncharacterized protein n=1 Tax=Rutidosis leptorrhynchoides TaxID=125765 RepID=UPI003A999825